MSKKVLDILNGNGWENKPKWVDLALYNYYKTSLHIDGVKPYSFFKGDVQVPCDNRYQAIFNKDLFSRHPRETDDQREWRFSQYRPFQRDAFLRSINGIIAAIFQDTGYSITIENSEDEDFIWGKSESKVPSFISQFTQKCKEIFTDAEGFLTVIPRQKWGTVKKAEPMIRFIKVEDILFLDNTNIIFKSENNEAWHITDKAYFKYIYNGEQYVEPKGGSGYYSHLLNQLPIVKAGGIKGKTVYESWLSGGIAFADEHVGSKSGEQLVNKEASHPWIMAASEDCGDCQGHGSIQHCGTCKELASACSCASSEGKFMKPELHTCSSCGGTGKQSRNPGDWMIVPKEDMASGGDLIKIVSPNVEVNRHLKSTAESVYLDLEKALHLHQDDSGASGISKTKTLESRYQFTMMICNDWFDRVIPSLLNFTLALRNAKISNGKIIPYVPNYTIIKPTQFSIKTSSDLLIELQISKQADLPSYIRAKQMEDYVDKHFGGDIVMAKIVRVVNELDIFANDSYTEIISTVNNDIGLREWQLHKQLPLILKKLVREKGTEWFVRATTESIAKEVESRVIYSEVKIINQNGESQASQSSDDGNAYYGQGNSATRTGASPTGTGFYNQEG